MKKETWRGEINFRRKDCTTFPAEASSGVSVTDDGLPMTVLSFRDISLLKFIENELGQARENLERGVRERTFELKRQAELLNLAYGATVVCDMDGNNILEPGRSMAGLQKKPWVMPARNCSIRSMICR